MKMSRNQFYTIRRVLRFHIVIHKCQHIEVHMSFFYFPELPISYGPYGMVHELYGLHMVLAIWVESLIHEID